MSGLKLKNIFDVINDYEVFLFDLWGVIIEGEETYPGVVDTINKILAQKTVFFVSNVPRPTAASLIRLKGWGLHVEEKMIITSGEVARQLIINQARKSARADFKVYHLGEDRNTELLADLEITRTDRIEEANILLLSLYREENEDLEEFDEILKKAARLDILTICANPDTILQNHQNIRFCAGYFAARMEKFGGNVIYTGKPKSEIYHKVFMQVPDIPKNRILMIGDTFETDILGAQNAGIHSALVLTGNAGKFHTAYPDLATKLIQLELAAQAAHIMPNFVINLV